MKINNINWELIKEVIDLSIASIKMDIEDKIMDSKFGYLRYIDNWHKVWIISNMMCKLGRHDYEFEKMDNGGAVLYCFYCEKKKHSINVSV